MEGGAGHGLDPQGSETLRPLQGLILTDKPEWFQKGNCNSCYILPFILSTFLPMIHSNRAHLILVLSNLILWIGYNVERLLKDAEELDWLQGGKRSAVQCSVIECNAVQCSVCSVVQCIVLQCTVLQCGRLWLLVTECNVSVTGGSSHFDAA